MDVPQEETLELPGGRKQAPSLQGFFLFGLVVGNGFGSKKQGTPKALFFFKNQPFFFWGGGFTMVFFFQRTRPQQNFHPQIFLQRSVTKEKLPPMTKEKNPRNFDEVQVVASKRDVDGYLEAPTNFEQ